jgi:hypothetical protein
VRQVTLTYAFCHGLALHFTQENANRKAALASNMPIACYLVKARCADLHVGFVANRAQIQKSRDMV